MNYYPFHLGDYAAHTGHLDPMEDLAYRRMLDLYYLREGSLPADAAEVARLIRMRQQVAEVESVLREFFVETEEGWNHARCNEEISRMHDKQAKARSSAAASVSARQANAARRTNERSTNVNQSLNVRSTDVELPTPTPTPTPEEKHKRSPRFDAQAHLVSLEVDPAIATDWLKLRKVKRADATVTAIDGVVREAEKAGLSLDAALRECCERGWAGFKAEWYRRESKPSGSRHAGFDAIDHSAGIGADGRF